MTQWRDEGPIFTYYTGGQWDLMYAPDLIEVRRRDENGDRTIKEYYLYPHSRGGNRLSMVCKGDSPLGPFTPVNMNEAGTATLSGSYIGFDPAIYIDYIDDPNDPDYEIGFRAYAYWGWMEAEAAELDQNTMWSVRPGTERIRDFIPCSSSYGVIRKPDIEYPYVAEGEELESFNYFEAFAMRKVGNKYVLTFSGYSGPDYGMSSTNSALRYAYGDTPLGPWKSGGVLVDSRGPVLNESGSGLVGRTWGHNTHGGLQEINGQWYVFYHRPPRGFGNARQAVVAPANIDWDEKSVAEGGKVTIRAYDPYLKDNTWTAKDSQEREYTGMEITSEGFHMYGLNPYKYYSAGIASYVDGGTLQDSYDIWDSHMPIENMRNGSRIGYKYFGFGGLDEDKKGLKAFEGTKPGNNTEFNVFLKPRTTASFKVNVWLDGPWANDTWKGTKIGEIVVPSDSSQETQRFQLDVADVVDNLDGKHAIYLVAEGSGTGNLFDLIGLGFSSDTKKIERPIMPELSIRINGNEMELPDWPLASTARNGIVGYDMYEIDPPTGLTSVPEIEAFASDKSVKITVSKPSSLSGIAYVRFEKDGKVKTYRIPFAKQEYNVSDELHLGITSVESAAGIIGDVLILDDADTFTDEQKAQKAKEMIDDMLQEALLENEWISGVNADVTYTDGLFVLKLSSGNTEMINSMFSVRSPMMIVPVTEVTLGKATLSLVAGTKETLKATVAPDNATIKEVTWSTSDESVATVDENGKVTAIQAGTATITATSVSNMNVKATCVIVVTENIPSIYGHSLTLDGTIGVNWYVCLPQNLQNTNTKMKFTYKGQVKYVSFDETANQIIDEGDTIYRFTYSVPAKEMTEEIKAELIGADNKPLLDEDNYTVKVYADEMLGSDKYGSKAKTFANALLNYGGYAQIYFGYKVNNAANEGIENLPQIDPTIPTEYEVSYNREIGTGDAVWYGSSLILESGTRIRHYVTIRDEDIARNAYMGYEGSDKKIELIAHPTAPNTYYADIENISAVDLKNMYTACIYKADGTAISTTKKYGAYTYGYNMLNNSSNDNLKDLVTALFKYSDESTAYLAELYQ